MAAPKRFIMPVRSFTTVDPLVTNHKISTNIAGLDVVPNAREVLLSMYDATIAKAEEYNLLNGKQAHNDLVIQLCKYRRAITDRNTDVRQIEKEARAGEIEEMIEEAEDEFDLLVAMNEVIKPWEADPVGDAHAALHEPEFGETPEQHVKNWKPINEAEMFKEFDAMLGLKPVAQESTPTSQSS